MDRKQGAFSKRMRTFMAGRNGMDELCGTAVVAGVIFLLLSGFGANPLVWLALALVVYGVWRCYSRNVAKRRDENEHFLVITEQPRAWFRLQHTRFKNRKEKRYFKCSECNTVCAVPRGKGKIRITCPTCKHKFEVKS